jgi:hypothetical protein
MRVVYMNTAEERHMQGSSPSIKTAEPAEQLGARTSMLQTDMTPHTCRNLEACSLSESRMRILHS